MPLRSKHAQSKSGLLAVWSSLLGLVVAPAAPAGAQLVFANEEAPPPLTSGQDVEVVPGEYVLLERPEARLRLTSLNALRSIGIEVSEPDPWTSSRLLKLPANRNYSDLVAALAQDPSVEILEPNYRVYAFVEPDDPDFSGQWGLKQIGAPAAWDRAAMASEVVVAVIDTGIAIAHPDLASNLWVNPGEMPNGIDDDGNGIVDDIHGARFQGGVSGNPEDDDGHGTHVAGIIGAVGNNGLGVSGTAWKVRLMAVKFLGPGGGTTRDAARAIAYATKMGAHLSNNSWGGGGASALLEREIERARLRGSLFVAAAGNSRTNIDGAPVYPASYPQDNILTVAATEWDDSLARFSNWGASSVDLGAPGTSILSTYPPDRLAWLQGTSMAAPFVSGVVALVKSEHPAWTVPQIKQHILATAEPTSRLAGKCVSGGRLSLAYALLGPLVLELPDQTSSWEKLTQQEVRWKRYGAACPVVRIQYARDGVNFWTTLAASTANDGSEMVLIPDLASRSARVRLECTDGAGESRSDPFRVFTAIKVVSPNGAEKFAPGAQADVSWDGSEADVSPPQCESVDILYSADSGRSYPFVLAPRVPNSGSIQPEVPLDESLHSRIRVACTPGIGQDDSDSDFSVQSRDSLRVSAGVIDTQLSPRNGADTVQMEGDHGPLLGLSWERRSKRLGLTVELTAATVETQLHTAPSEVNVDLLQVASGSRYHFWVGRGFDAWAGLSLGVERSSVSTSNHADRTEGDGWAAVVFASSGLDVRLTKQAYLSLDFSLRPIAYLRTDEIPIAGGRLALKSRSTRLSAGISCRF